MTVFLGNQGNVLLRRSSSIGYGSLGDQIIPDDVNTTLNRLSFDGATANLLVGDKLDISTTDPRGLICFPPSTWSSDQVEDTITVFVHVNAMGGLRFFTSFADAVNNNRAVELPLATFEGDPLPITVKVRDVSYNMLGNVTSYNFNTDRDAIDTTTIGDKFKQQYSAGLISGSGTIDCQFSYKTTGIAETPLLMLQLIQRVDIGSNFDLALYLSDKSLNPNLENIFYNLSAVVTRSGIDVAAGSTITCSIDFLTTGEMALVYGKPSDYILKEDDDRIELQQSLDFLLQEIDD